MFTKQARLTLIQRMDGTQATIWETKNWPTGANANGPRPMALELLRIQFEPWFESWTSYSTDYHRPTNGEEYWAQDGATVNTPVYTGPDVLQGRVAHEWYALTDQEDVTDAVTLLNPDKRLCTARLRSEFVAQPVGTGTRYGVNRMTWHSGYVWDFTDNAGNGLLLACRELSFGGMSIFANDNTGTAERIVERNQQVVGHCLVRITYRMRSCSMAEFISAAQD